jgi:hypothetical protein
MFTRFGMYLQRGSKFCFVLVVLVVLVMGALIKILHYCPNAPLPCSLALQPCPVFGQIYVDSKWFMYIFQLNLSRGCMIYVDYNYAIVTVVIPLDRKLRHYEETNEIENNVLRNSCIYFWLETARKCRNLGWIGIGDPTEHPAALPSSLARQPCPAALPGSLARQPCLAGLITGRMPAGLKAFLRP